MFVGLNRTLTNENGLQKPGPKCVRTSTPKIYQYGTICAIVEYCTGRAGLCGRSGRGSARRHVVRIPCHDRRARVDSHQAPKHKVTCCARQRAPRPRPDFAVAPQRPRAGPTDAGACHALLLAAAPFVQGANTLNDAWAGPCVQEQDGAARNLNDLVQQERGVLQDRLEHEQATVDSMVAAERKRLQEVRAEYEATRQQMEHLKRSMQLEIAHQQESHEAPSSGRDTSHLRSLPSPTHPHLTGPVCARPRHCWPVEGGVDWVQYVLAAQSWPEPLIQPRAQYAPRNAPAQSLPALSQRSLQLVMRTDLDHVGKCQAPKAPAEDKTTMLRAWGHAAHLGPLMPSQGFRCLERSCGSRSRPKTVL